MIQRQSTRTLAVDDPEVVQGYRFIQEHACDGIGVTDVTGAVALSRRNLERRSHRLAGRTLHEQIILVPIERARLLLASIQANRPALAIRAIG